MGDKNTSLRKGKFHSIPEIKKNGYIFKYLNTGAVHIEEKDNNTPRNQWKLGTVTDTHPGRDGLVRRVTVKTKTGNLQHPVNKLCMLLHSQCLTSE